jgi:hypothetical protein
MESKDSPLDSEHIESAKHEAGKTVHSGPLVWEDRQTYGEAGMFLPLPPILATLSVSENRLGGFLL